MKRIACGFLAASLWMNVLPVSAATVPTVEPDTGFTRGPDPEWSAGHLQDHEDREDHRRFHQMMEDERREWLQMHSALDPSSTEYTDGQRLMMEELNFNHRESHSHSEDWHFQFGSTVTEIGSTEVKTPVVAFSRTGRPANVVKVSRRELQKNYYARVAGELSNASRLSKP